MSEVVRDLIEIFERLKIENSLTLQQNDRLLFDSIEVRSSMFRSSIIEMHPDEVNQILKFLERFEKTKNKHVLRGLASCNNVLYRIENGETCLHIGTCIPNTTIVKHADGDNNDQVKYVYFRNKNEQTSIHPLPGVDKLYYYCDCQEWCNCEFLTLPKDSELFYKMQIFRNGRGPFVLEHRHDYREYIKYLPKFTYDPSCIIRDGLNLSIDYKKYYHLKNSKTATSSNQFWVSIDIGQITITKPTTDIPLMSELVLDFPKHAWVYKFNTFSSLMSDMDLIKNMLGDVVINLQKC